MTDIDDLLKDIPVSPPSLTGAQGPKHTHRFERTTYLRGEVKETVHECRCGHVRDEAAARRGKNSRSYGNRAELLVARKYGGDKVGQAGGPVDVRGKDFDTQVRTKRRPAPGEWVKAIDAMRDGTRVPRILLRYVQTGGTPPDDWFVFRAKDFLDWFGKDE